jgi:hypothetical protein
MKCWNSAFNARGPRLNIVLVVTVEALRKKERQDETQFTTKIDGFLSFNPHWMLMYFQVFWRVWPNSGFWCCVFALLYNNSIISTQFRTVTRRVRSEVNFTSCVIHIHTYIHTYIQQVPSHLPNPAYMKPEFNVKNLKNIYNLMNFITLMFIKPTT